MTATQAVGTERARTTIPARPGKLPHFGLSRSSAAIKRSFDLLSATVAIVVFAPVMLAAAVWIKLDTPGPVLFRQTRVGRDGGYFSIWKRETDCSRSLLIRV